MIVARSRKKKLIFFGVFLVLACGILAGCLILFHDPVNPWTSNRIRVGMTEAEVQAVLGRPADREYHPWDIMPVMMPAPGLLLPEWEKLWLGNEWAIIVHFDADGKVGRAACGDKDFDKPPPRTISRFLWKMLGW